MIETHRSLIPSLIAQAARRALALFCAAGLLSASVVQAEPASIQEFMGRKEQWPDLVGSFFQLEGRVETFGDMDMRMKNCTMPFVFKEAPPRPRTLPYVTISGRLERDGRKLQFLATSLQDGKSESQMIREKIRLGDSSDPKLYDQLADWAASRAEFYEDPDLRQESRRLYAEGISVAMRRLPAADAEGFLALAAKAVNLAGSDALAKDALHRAARAELRQEAQSRTPDFLLILARIRDRFPGADAPRPELSEELARSYARNPPETYSNSDGDVRRALERLLYVETAEKLAEATLKPDHSNGFAAAKIVETHIPERPELAAKYRELEVKAREAVASTMSRQEVMELRNDLRRLQQPERAQRVVKAWIERRFASRREGPQAAIDRAEHELEMADDKSAALDLVSAAMQVDPAAPGGLELLDRMGYAWHERRAILKEHVPAAPPDPIVRAMQEGRILPGMSDAQVRATLGGAPDNVVRMASLRGVTELWHYPAQRLTISLTGTRGSPDLRVSQIVELKASSPSARKR